MRRPERFAQPDLASALGDGDEHDVNNADRTQGKRDHTDHTEEVVHAVKDPGDALVVFDRVPILERLFKLGIEAVTAGDNVVDFLFRHQMISGRKRTVVQERDGIFAVLLFQAKQVAHGLDRNKDARIGAIVAVLADFAEHTDNLEADAIEQNGRAYGRTAGEYVFQQLPADHGHSPRLGIVLVIEPAAGADGHIADLVVFRRNAEDLAIGGPVVADGANVLAVEYRGKILERARLAANGEIILISEMVSAAGLRAAFDRGDTPGEAEHDVLAKILELPRLPAAKALAQANQQEQRSHAPGDAEHGKERPQLMGPERGQRLANDFDEHPHSWFTPRRLRWKAKPRAWALLCSTGSGAARFPKKTHFTLGA